MTDPLGHVTHFLVYGAGSGPNTEKLGSIDYPDGTHRRFYNYEYSGQAQTLQDPNSCQAQANGQSPWYEAHYFDNTGRPTLICSGRANVNTTFTYGDPRGFLTSTNFPDGTQQTATYDAMGNVIKTVDRSGVVACTLSYNYLNQLSGRSWNDTVTPAEVYGYDANRPNYLNNGFTLTGYAYNDAGEVSYEGHDASNNGNYAYTQYHYDPNGVTDEVFYPGLDAELPTTTGRNQLDTQRFQFAGNATLYTMGDYNYNADGQLSQRYAPNGTYTAYGFDAGGRVNAAVNYRYSPLIEAPATGPS